MKEVYEKMEIVIEVIDAEDVISASGFPVVSGDPCYICYIEYH